MKNQRLFDEIDRWECESIKKIQRTAKDARELLLNHTNKDFQTIEKQLDLLTNDLKQNQGKNNFTEINLDDWTRQLNELKEQLDNMKNSIVEDNSTVFIKKISVLVHSPQITIATIPPNARWMQHGVTVAGGNGWGNKLDQLANPWGLCLDNERTIYIADTANHRVVAWSQNGKEVKLVAGGNDQGWRMDQLSFPGSVVIDKKNDCLVILDNANNRVMQWPCRNGIEGKPIIEDISCEGLAIDNNGDIYISGQMTFDVKRYKQGERVGRIVAGGNGHGNDLNQIGSARYIFVDEEYSIYISDSMNNRVVKWTQGATEGILVAGGNGQGNARTQLSAPCGIVVDRTGSIYIADCRNHRIVCWTEDAKEGDVIIGENGMLQNPSNLAFDSDYNLYVLDSGNERVQKFFIQK